MIMHPIGQRQGASVETGSAPLSSPLLAVANRQSRTSDLSSLRTNEMLKWCIIAPDAQVHNNGIGTEQPVQTFRCPKVLDISANRRMTMRTTITLLLAARVVAGLTLGSAAAIAQDGPSGPAQDYQAAKIFAARQVPQVQAPQVQAGASDVNAAWSGFQVGPFHATPDRGVATVGGD